MIVELPRPSFRLLLVHYIETLKHKYHVARFMLGFAARLVWRAVVHDLSKFGPNEAPYFASQVLKLRGITYGSDEYRECLRVIKPALSHHYAVNSHHPENWEYGVRGMNLCDFVEMWCDWNAAVLRHEDGDIQKSITINMKRFDLDPQLTLLLRHGVQ